MRNEAPIDKRPAEAVPATSRRRRRRWPLLLGAILLLSVIAFGVQRLRAGKSRTELPTHVVHYEQWRPTIEAQGDLEPVFCSDIVCRVRALTPGSTFATT